jgi:hypothetical protein
MLFEVINRIWPGGFSLARQEKYSAATTIQPCHAIQHDHLYKGKPSQRIDHPAMSLKFWLY